jgi:hypothetical protein
LGLILEFEYHLSEVLPISANIAVAIFRVNVIDNEKANFHKYHPRIIRKAIVMIKHSKNLSGKMDTG